MLTNEKIDIVMTTWKRETISLLSINTLMQNTDYPFRLIIVDNGSDTFTQALYQQTADEYYKFDSNMGLEYAKNYAMKFVKSSLFISTDNDILVPKRERGICWLTRLMFLKSDNPEYAAIALRPQVLVGTGDIFGNDPKPVHEFSHVPGYMRIMETSLVNEVGAWNESRPLRGHEEYWISDRFKKRGRKVGFASYIKCYHLFGNDTWGYENMTPEETGHNPVALPKDNWTEIYKDYL